MEELLKEFLKENKELEALLVVDEEGIVVYKEVKDELPFDPEEVAVELVNPSNRINELVEDSLGEQGGLEEILVLRKDAFSWSLSWLTRLSWLRWPVGLHFTAV